MSDEHMKASTQKVLRLLRQAGSHGVTTSEFAEGRCPRASARICELRHDWGCEVEATRLRDNAYRFTLTYEPPGRPVDGATGTVSPADRPVAAVDPEAEAPEPEPIRAAPVATEQRLFDTIDIDIPKPSTSPYEAA